MDDAAAGGELLLFFCLLAVDILFYGFSASLRALRPEEADGKGDKKARELTVRELSRRRLLQKITDDPRRYLDTMQLVLTLVHILYGTVFLRTLARLLTVSFPSLGGVGKALVLAGVTAALLFVVTAVGFLLPKRLASEKPEAWAQACVTPVYALVLALTPLTALASAAVSGLLYLCGIRGGEPKEDVTAQEIRSLVSEGHEQGVIQQTEAEMITNIFDFSDKQAHDIMTHRTNVVGIDQNYTLGEAISFMLGKRNSRFPLYDGDIDHITGILHLRDAVKYRESHPDENRPLAMLTGVARTPVFVPETKNIDALFRQMQQTKTQMVIVVDEYGQTSGLIAMEDILEEIVGNILDEYDVDETHITPTKNLGEFIMDGGTPLEELEKKFGISFKEGLGEMDFETLNGFLISRMEKIPEPGEHFSTDYGGYRFRVLSVADRKVQRVLVQKLADAPQESGRSAGA